MAVDGRKFSDTLRLGSDDWCEFPCSPCAKDGKDVVAIKHCVECGENLCKTCLTYHEKFTRGHQILDKLSSKAGQKRSELPVQRCDKHGGKLVDVFCPGHDIVGCATCMNVDHSTCKEIRYIPEIASKSHSSKELSKLESTLKHLLSRLDQLKTQKQENLKRFQREKDLLLKEIRDLRKKINDKLDKMEGVLVQELDNKYITKTQADVQNIDNINKMKSVLETRQKTLADAKKINDSELFVQMKLLISSVQETELTLTRVCSHDGSRLTRFVPNKDIVRLLSDENLSLGRVREDHSSVSVTHFKDINVCLQSDKHACFIEDACFTANGDVIITDNANKRIKKLDHNYAITEHLNMPATPACLCEVNSTEIAVSLIGLKQVQFVYQQPLKLGKSFTVRDRCRGIDYNDGQLYVCCGGRIDEGEGQGHIEVYNINGDFLVSYYDGLRWPGRIIVSDRNELFVTDKKDDKLMYVDMHSYHMSEMRIEKLSGRLGSCRIGDGQLCLAGFGSNNIVLISENGKRQQELLTEKDGIVEPWAIYCQPSTSDRKLQVGLDLRITCTEYISKSYH